MPETLTLSLVSSIFNETPTKIADFFHNFNRTHAQTMKWENLSDELKKLLGEKIGPIIEIPQLTVVLLTTVRILSRDRVGLDELLNGPLCAKILDLAALPTKKGYPVDVDTQLDAQKTLVNALFNSENMREKFFERPENTTEFPFYLAQLEDSRRQTSSFEWVRKMDEHDAAESWYFYHRIAFIVTAYNKEYQKTLSDSPDTVDNQLLCVEYVLNKRRDHVLPMDISRAHESLKTFFNIFCHFHGETAALEGDYAVRACTTLRQAVCAKSLFPDEVLEAAVHAVSVPPVPMLFEILCANETGAAGSSSSSGLLENDGMTFVEAILSLLERRLDLPQFQLDKLKQIGEPGTDATTTTDMLGPYFQLLTRLCVDSKHARRYCRMRVIPPLNAEDVKRRPEECTSLRGKIVRLLMVPSVIKDVVSQFLFIISKRSVDRMIKYFGFGHSAGHIANAGLLGELNKPKRESDSEDSETEEYNAVRNRVNPVTAALQHPDRGLELANMTPEQKECEAMKLVEAMSRIMEEGIVKPGTIGEDGRIREVSHVLELLKNAPEPPASDSDSD